jgi:hypothetical protein
MELVSRIGLTGLGVSTGLPGVFVGVGTPVGVPVGVTLGSAEGVPVGVTAGVTLADGPGDSVVSGAGLPEPGVSLPHATSTNGRTASPAAYFHPRTDMSSTFCSALPRPDGR